MNLYKILNCNITIQGDGKGRYGKPKTTKTGPLSDFLVDNSVFYIAVTKHLKECDHCSIDAVLTEYLQRRLEITKFDGKSSLGLAKRAIILERLAGNKGQTLTKGVVNELLWRSGASAVVEYGYRLSLREKFLAFRVNKYQVPNLNKENQLLADISRQDLNQDITSEELRKMITIAEVMLY